MPGDVLVWREIYTEGPVPGNLSDEDFREIRAGYLSSIVKLAYDGVLQGTNARYDMLTDAGKYGEVILWFDACMFDQTIMVHLIDQCARQEWTATGLSLICIEFAGLGELNPEQLASVMETRHELTPNEVDLASRGWRAFRSG